MQNILPKKVLIIYAGGAKFTAKTFSKWLDNFFELQVIANTSALYLEYSSENAWQKSQKIVLTIKKEYNNFDGFVVIHGLNDLIFVSSMVAFMAQKIGKPIVFTAPSVSEDAKQSKKNYAAKYLPLTNFEDLAFKSNLINSVQIAAMNITEVGVALGNHLVRAVGAKYSWSDPIFSAHNISQNLLARIQFGIQPAANIKKHLAPEPRFLPDYNNNVKFIEYHSGISDISSLRDCEGVFIKAYSADILPKEIFTDKSRIVCLYLTQPKNKDENIIVAKEISWEVGLAKFIWAMGQSRDFNKVKKIMGQSLAGE